MKLIVSGATGFLATEVIRQSLQRPEITSVVAVSRRPITAPQGADPSKLKNLVLKDFNHYSEADKRSLPGPKDASELGNGETNRRRQIARAGALRRTIGLTPTKMSHLTPADHRRICLDYTMAGIKAMHEAGPEKPLRFVYVSGFSISRDEKQRHWFAEEYLKLRGEVERSVIKYAGDSNGDIEAMTVRPGLITPRGAFFSRTAMKAVGLLSLGYFKALSVEEIAATMIDQVVNGIQKDLLMNNDLATMGQKLLAEQQK
ncbi:unnamed protein product [Parascedosporium putredinis]|uniref:NAD(P)-binding domain-containing protein n=1 Tax=Parascedosporium putredinis TaxID=1442378 RepID=A0A9P1GVG5_9PEZI|nr:unnamed protein product [Parascedosporium putredinis]CAI7987848.1 unnamed protein product [Parascedosporium putredinis]